MERGPATQDRGLTGRARELRRNQTRAEGKLWEQLRGHRLGGWKWRRQVPRGPFIIDFYCPALCLAVELDGKAHDDMERKLYDLRRTAWLRRERIRVIRFRNEEVFERILGVCDAILTACGGEAPHPTSPRKRGEEKAELGA